MERIVINWLETNYDDMDYEEDAYFYALLDEEDELVYIGSVYDQEIQDGIERNMRDFDLNTETTGIFIGYINDMTYERISKQIVADAKCLMIHLYQPEYNTQCKKSYTGRLGFEIISNDLFEEISTISCGDDESFWADGEVVEYE
ncbi:hypothetical protein [uncultured Microscilla sp.]|uniref:hypothetical protein n=1 Tax=uncultured Microscilla sp. TaxID=432653 RepID=UPI0026177975|nr:hypothetical protein [uncultured Microscilla sp.]